MFMTGVTFLLLRSVLPSQVIQARASTSDSTDTTNYRSRYHNWLQGLESELSSYLTQNATFPLFSSINSSSSPIACKVTSHDAARYHFQGGTFNNLCVGPVGELVWWEDLIHNEHCPAEWLTKYSQGDNQGNVREFPIQRLSVQNRDKAVSVEWHRVGVLNLYTLPANIFHWNTDTFWPLMVAYKGLYELDVAEKLNFFRQIPGQEGMIGQLDLNQNQFQATDSPLNKIPEEFRGRFTAQMSPSLNPTNSTPLYYHILPAQFMKRLSYYSDVMFVLLANDIRHGNMYPTIEYKKPDDDHWVTKNVHDLDLLGFDWRHRFFAWSRADPNSSPLIASGYKKRLTSIGWDLDDKETRMNFDWNIHNQFNYTCFERGLLGTPSNPDWYLVHSQKNFYLQSILAKYKVIDLADPLSKCPLYWFRQEQCQIQSKLNLSAEWAAQAVNGKAAVNTTFLLTDSQTQTQYVRDPAVVYVTILNRKGGRKILNINEIVSQLLAMYSNLRVRVIEVEEMSIAEQLQQFSCETNIYVFVHGAGGGNLQYLPRHSVVVEIGPVQWGRYFAHTTEKCGHRYFGADIPTNLNSCYEGKCGKDQKIVLPFDWFNDLFAGALMYARESQYFTAGCQ